MSLKKDNTTQTQSDDNKNDIQLANVNTDDKKVVMKKLINTKVINAKVINKNKGNSGDKRSGISKSATKVEVETRQSLQHKVKFFEEEVERYELERARILQELDRVCEEKDNQIRELKTALHEKQMEIDHQLASFKKQRLSFEDEANALRAKIEQLNKEFDDREKELNAKNTNLEEQLSDLNDYIVHKEQTMAKVRELELILKQERIFHEQSKQKLTEELNLQKKRVEDEVRYRVIEIATNLESNCMQKLSTDAKVAIEKFMELSRNYEFSEIENGKLRHENKTIKVTLHNQRIRLEVAESLLNEMLKQLSRKLNNRTDAAVQCDYYTMYTNDKDKSAKTTLKL